MSGKRMLHENICESRKLSAVSYAAETLYYRILTQVDDNGNFSADPSVVRGRCLARRKDATDKKTGVWLGELIAVELLKEYEAEGERYVHVADFEKFQKFRSDVKTFRYWPPHPDSLGPQLARYDCVTGFVPETERERDENGTDAARERPEFVHQRKGKEIKEKETVSCSESAGSVFEKARKLYRRIIGKSIGSLGRREHEWQGLVAKHGADVVLVALELCAREKKDFLKGMDFPLQFFLKNSAEWIEAAQIERERAASPEKESDEPKETMVTAEDIEKEYALPDQVFINFHGRKKQVHKTTAADWIARGIATPWAEPKGNVN
jgi:hypothetical protein